VTDSLTFSHPARASQSDNFKIRSKKYFKEYTVCDLAECL
jgi:hypothetical protein